MNRRALAAGAGGGVLALLFGASLLWACGSTTDTLDDAATERAVGEAIDAQVGPTVEATVCTGDLVQAKGATFTCEVTLGGDAGVLQVDVTQTDQEGNLEVAARAVVLSDAQVASQAKRALADHFDRSFQVDCGSGGASVRPPGSTFECTARDRSNRRVLQVTVEDAAGTLAFEVVPGPAPDGD